MEAMATRTRKVRTQSALDALLKTQVDDANITLSISLQPSDFCVLIRAFLMLGGTMSGVIRTMIAQAQVAKLPIVSYTDADVTRR